MKKTKKEAFDLERATIENNIKNKLDRIKANSSKIAGIILLLLKREKLVWKLF